MNSVVEVTPATAVVRSAGTPAIVEVTPATAVVRSAVVDTPVARSPVVVVADAQPQSYRSMVDDKSINNELVKLGYVPRTNLIVNNQVKYVKAIDKNGNFVYIDLDTQGYVNIRSEDLTLEESTTASAIPQSVRISAEECAGSDTCGVLFECRDGVCTLRNDNAVGATEELSLRYTEPYSTRSLMDNNVISYPIVRLSEIRANPGLVLDNTLKVTANLRNKAWTRSTLQVDAMEASIRNLVDTFKRFDRVRTATAEGIVSDLGTLRSSGPSVLATDSDRYRASARHYNIVRRNGMIVDLLRDSEDASSLRTRIDEITLLLNGVVNNLGALDSKRGALLKDGE